MAITATNRETGDRVIWNGQDWIPYQDPKDPNRYVDGMDTITGKPAVTATNRKTDQKIYYHQGLDDWLPVPIAEKPPEPAAPIVEQKPVNEYEASAMGFEPSLPVSSLPALRFHPPGRTVTHEWDKERQFEQEQIAQLDVGPYEAGATGFEPTLPKPGAGGMIEATGQLATAPIGLAAAGTEALGRSVKLIDAAFQGREALFKELSDMGHSIGATIEAFTYQPKTEEGQKAAEDLFYPFTKLHEFGDYLTQKIYQETGSPFWSAFLGSIPEAIPGALPFLHRIKGRPTTALTPKDSQFQEGITTAQRLRNIRQKYGADSAQYKAAFQDELQKRMPSEKPSAAQPPQTPAEDLRSFYEKGDITIDDLRAFKERAAQESPEAAAEIQSVIDNAIAKPIDLTALKEAAVTRPAGPQVAPQPPLLIPQIAAPLAEGIPARPITEPPEMPTVVRQEPTREVTEYAEGLREDERQVFPGEAKELEPPAPEPEYAEEQEGRAVRPGPGEGREDIQQPEPEQPGRKERLRARGLLIKTGTVMITKSGRETSPAPKIEATTDRKTLNTINRMYKWLLDEAIKEAETNADYWNATIFKNYNPNNLSQADVDSINLYLWGEFEATADNVKIQEEPGRKERLTKKRKALQEYQDYIGALTDEQRELAGDLIVEQPEQPSVQLNKIRKAIEAKQETIESAYEKAVGSGTGFPDRAKTLLDVIENNPESLMDPKKAPEYAQLATELLARPTDSWTDFDHRILDELTDRGYLSTVDASATHEWVVSIHAPEVKKAPAFEEIGGQVETVFPTTLEPEAEAAEAVEMPRPKIIDNILTAAKKKTPKIEPVYKLEGTDGKFYPATGIPTFVKVKEGGQRIITGYKFVDRYGVGYGTIGKTKEELVQRWEDAELKKQEGFRSELEKSSDKDLEQQAKFWLKKDVAVSKKLAEAKFGEFPYDPDAKPIGDIKKEMDAVADYFKEAGVKVDHPDDLNFGQRFPFAYSRYTRREYVKTSQTAFVELLDKLIGQVRAVSQFGEPTRKKAAERIKNVVKLADKFEKIASDIGGFYTDETKAKGAEALNVADKYLGELKRKEKEAEKERQEAEYLAEHPDPRVRFGEKAVASGGAMMFSSELPEKPGSIAMVLPKGETRWTESGGLSSGTWLIKKQYLPKPLENRANKDQAKVIKDKGIPIDDENGVYDAASDKSQPLTYRFSLLYDDKYTPNVAVYTMPDGEVIPINEAYITYFRSKIKDFSLRTSKENGPVAIMSGDEVAGAVMPLSKKYLPIDGLDFSLLDKPPEPIPDKYLPKEEIEKRDEKWKDQIVGKMAAEGAKNLSDAEIERILGETVGAGKLIENAKRLRDKGKLTFEDIQRYGKPIEEPEFAFTETETAAPKGISADELKATLRPIADSWISGPSLEIVQKQSELPARLQYGAGKGARIHGAFSRGKVYLVADNFDTVEGAVKTLIHEAFGHFGLKSMLGRPGRKIFSDIYSAKKTEIESVAKGYGLDTTEPTQRDRAIEEWLARESEKVPGDRFIDRVVAAVKKFLRKIGIKVKYADSEIRQLLVRARDHVKYGTRKRKFFEARRQAQTRSADAMPETEFAKVDKGKIYDDFIKKYQKESESYASKQKPVGAGPAQPQLKYEPVPPGRRHAALLKKVQKGLDVPIRIGKFRQRARGIYKVKPQVIRLKKANDIETAMHEVGHHLQKLLGMEKVPKDVKDMAYPGAADVGKEGFAEFVRVYVTEPDKARNGAPQFYKDFEATLEQAPSVQDILIDVRKAWHEWKATPSVAKVGSFIIRGEDAEQPARISLNKLYARIKDKYHPIKRVTEIARKEKGAQIKPQDDPYILARLLAGWARRPELFLKHTTFQFDEQRGMVETGPPFRDIIREVEKKGLTELFDIYQVAKRAEMDPENRVARGFDGILSREDFLESVKELEPLFKSVGEKLQKYHDELLKYLVASGRISAKTADLIKKKNPFYAPMYRLMDGDSEFKHLGKKADRVFNPVKRFSGRSSRMVFSPTESAMFNTYAMINAADRNRVGNALRKLAKVEGMGKILEKIPFPIEPQKITRDDFLRLLREYASMRRVAKVEQFEKEITSNLKSLAKTPTGKVEAKVLEALRSRGWSEGEAQQIIERVKNQTGETQTQTIEKIIEKTVITTIKEELDLSGMPDEVIATFRPVYQAKENEVIFYNEGKPELYEVGDTELYKALSSMAPEQLNTLVKFLAFPARMLRAGATTFSPGFAIRNPQRDQLTAWLQSEHGFFPGKDFINGLIHLIGRTEQWRRFSASGAAHAALVSTGKKYMTKQLRDLYKERVIVKTALNPLKFMELISEAMEEATRVGAFIQAQKKLGPSLDAMLLSGMTGREISLDFSRTGGGTAQALNMISAFWNARLEGLDKMRRTFRDRPVKTALKAFAGITLPSVILWWLQKDDPYYQELPAWRKIIAWNIVLHNDDGTLKRIIPIWKPFEYGTVFGSMVEAILEAWYKKDPELLKEAGKATGEALNLVPYPTAIVPLVENWSNRSLFFDGPIVPRSRQTLEPYMQYRESTSEMLKLIGRIMNKVPGLREYASPALMQNIIRGYTAALGEAALETGDFLLEKLGVIDVPLMPERDIMSLPGLSALSVRWPTANTRSIELFYKKYEKMNRQWETQKELAGIRGKGIRTKEAKPPELQIMDAAKNTLAVLGGMANEVYDNPKMGRVEKRRALDFIYISMTNVAAAALGRAQVPVKPKSPEEFIKWQEK